MPPAGESADRDNAVPDNTVNHAHDLTLSAHGKRQASDTMRRVRVRAGTPALLGMPERIPGAFELPWLRLLASPCSDRAPLPCRRNPWLGTGLRGRDREMTGRAVSHVLYPPMINARIRYKRTVTARNGGGGGLFRQIVVLAIVLLVVIVLHVTIRIVTGETTRVSFSPVDFRR